MEKEGVLEYLTKSLVSLIEVKHFSKLWLKGRAHLKNNIYFSTPAQVSLYEADKPNSALDYLKNNFSGKETEILQLKVSNLTR